MASAKKAYAAQIPEKKVAPGRGDKGKRKMQESESESEDEGLNIGDLITEGSDSLNVGPDNKYGEIEGRKL